MVLKAMFRALAAMALGAIGTTTNSANAQPHEGDIILDVHEGAIRTGDYLNGSFAPWRIFSAFLPANNFTSDPGFDCLPGTFPVGTRVGWNAMAGLQRWTGEGFELTDGETMTVSFFTTTRTIADAPVAGFDLAVQSDGGWHRHLGYLLNPAPGEAQPLPGVYLIELEIYSTATEIEASLPFWKFFNRGASADEMAAAEAYLLQALEAEPNCPADLDGSGTVDLADLLVLLGAWGPCDGDCPADLDGNGMVDLADLLVLLGAWGPCPL